MLREEIDELYFNWLVDQVAFVNTRRGRRARYQSLFQQMHETIFVALVSHDENRIADAKTMRADFLSEHKKERGDLSWMRRSPCSMLEIFIILSQQLSFLMDSDAKDWFWHLIYELDLEKYDDRAYDDSPEETEDAVSMILDRVVWRSYDPSGKGGLFPLQHPERDQRDVELWYQLNAYLLENF